MATKRSRSDTQSGPPAAKVSKHRRSNSGSVSQGDQDKAVEILNNIIPLCAELEKLLGVSDDESHGSSMAGSSGESGSAKKSSDSPSKVDLFPAGFLNQVKAAQEDHSKFGDWLAAAMNSSHDKQLSYPKSLPAINEEGEDEGEECNKLSFSYLKQIASNLKDNVTLLKGIREVTDDRNLKVEIIPFSSIIAKDYDKLAIQDHYDEVDLESLWNNLNGESGIFSSMTMDGLLHFATRLDTAKTYVNAWTEMTARKVIDAYLDSVNDAQIFKDLPIVNSPEFGILGHSKEKPPNAYPVINSQKKLKTYLNGSTDYLTILMSGEDLRKHIESGLKQYRSKSRRKAWLEQIMQQASMNTDMRLSVCEAKWPGARLEKHIPQVVAEAIGLQLNTGRHFVPFCLSNGVEWVFGALHACGNTSSASYRFWTTKTYRVNSGHEAVIVLGILRFWVISREIEVWNLGCPKRWLGTSETIVQKLKSVRVAPPSESVPPETEIQPGYTFPANTATKKAAGRGRRAGGH